MEEEMEPLTKKIKVDNGKEGRADRINNDCKLADEIKNQIPADVEINIDNEDFSLSEQKFGLDCFLREGTRLSGMIKQRFTDFIVRECDQHGNPVVLNDLNHIDDSFKQVVQPTECPLSADAVTQIEEFVTNGNADKTKNLTLEPDDDKEHRKLVHKYIKDTFKRIETDTVELEGGSRAIKLSFKSNNSNNKNQRRPEWLKNLPKFCHFVLYKEGRTTAECISSLARMTHTKAACFSFAGTKDRRGATVQRVSAKNMHSKQLSGLNPKLKNMAVGNFSYNDNGINLGDLSGNQFTIVIRDVVEADEKIDATLGALKDIGFVNYFGLQRFGTGIVPTHSVGKLLLQSKFKEAVDLILYPTDDLRFEGEAKVIWKNTRDAKQACKAVKSKVSIEGKILEHLSKQQIRNSISSKQQCDNPSKNRTYEESVESSCEKSTVNEDKCAEEVAENSYQKQAENPSKTLSLKMCDKPAYNYFNSFQALPRNSRLIYLHAYQSLIWNEMVSKRIQEYGKKPCVGDFVLAGEKDENDRPRPTVLTEANLDNFTIYDVVLPLPGYDVTYPSNEIGECYKERLSKDGTNLESKKRIRELSLPGTYRHIAVKPKDVTWNICIYDHYMVPLVKTDLVKVKEPASSQEMGNETKFEEGIKYKGIRLEMTLPTSCYATSALREVLLFDSSYKSQVKLHQNFQAKDSNGIKVSESV